MEMNLESTKVLITIVSTIIALFVFIKGVIEFVHLNAIRRYEKFHEMSVRFDDNDDIQDVCAVLHGTKPAAAVTKQQKEVFICFLEEIYFMMNRPTWIISRRIMNRDLALYTFGHYGNMAFDSKQFWHDLNKYEPFYVHFLEFCRLARSYLPSSVASSKRPAY